MICSSAAARTSNARTIAPRPFAAPSADSPATPAPMIRTFAGGTLPAAVNWPVKKLPNRFARLDHRAIAGDVRHRRQRVHLLRAADARHLIHREHGDLARGERGDQRLVLRRIQERDQARALAQLRDLRRSRAARTLSTMSARPRGGARRRSSRRRLVLRVGEVCGGAGAALDVDGPAGLRPFRDHVRRCRDAPLVRTASPGQLLTSSAGRVCPNAGERRARTRSARTAVSVLEIGGLRISRELIAHPLLGRAHVIEHGGVRDHGDVASSTGSGRRGFRRSPRRASCRRAKARGYSTRSPSARWRRACRRCATRGRIRRRRCFERSRDRFARARRRSRVHAPISSRARRGSRRDELPIDFAPAPHASRRSRAVGSELRDGIERAVIDGTAFERDGSPGRSRRWRAAEIWFGDAPYARVAQLVDRRAR